jgi:hypothetical protein
VKDPTYAEVLVFIAEDKTEQVVPADHCLASIIVIENAAKKGIRAYWVVAGLAAGVGYNFVGFNTTDKGWVYFMASYPPTYADKEVVLSVGSKFSKLNPAFGSISYYNDTIVSIHYLPIP